MARRKKRWRPKTKKKRNILGTRQLIVKLERLDENLVKDLQKNCMDSVKEEPKRFKLKINSSIRPKFIEMNNNAANVDDYKVKSYLIKERKYMVEYAFNTLESYIKEQRMNFNSYKCSLDSITDSRWRDLYPPVEYVQYGVTTSCIPPPDTQTK